MSSSFASSSSSANSSVFFLILLLHLPSLTASYYFVLTRYSPLPTRRFDAASVLLPTFSVGTSDHRPSSAEWASGEVPEKRAQSLPLSMKRRVLPIYEEKGMGVMLMDDELELEGTKRSAESTKNLPIHEHVCSTIIRTDHRPTFGHEQNGTRVQIQQDEQRQFSATFVECSNTKREKCHGIDNAMFSSECVTVFEFRPAGVRVEGNAGNFVEGLVRVPITCQCRLRRKIGPAIFPS